MAIVSAMRRATDFRLGSEAGVTLVEMIVAIVVTGILVALASMFGRNQIEAYFDVTNRAALTDAADTALRRIARDLQAALPNSVRVSGDYIEFVPVRDAGRYRAMLTPAATGDILDFTLAADSSFDVLGPTVAVAAGEQLVVYNLGIPGADVHVGDVRRAIPAGGVGATRQRRLHSSANPMPLASPMNRFTSSASRLPIVVMSVRGRAAPLELRLRCGTADAAWRRQQCDPCKWRHGLCHFHHAPGVQQRNGIVSIRLTLTGNGESVTLMQQVDVLNSP